MKSNNYKKEQVYKFDGLIEGKYTFAGYEGSVILYKISKPRYPAIFTSRIPQELDVYYFIEAKFKAIANDYMYMARPEFKIWGQHPYLTENDTLFFSSRLPFEINEVGLCIFDILQDLLNTGTYVGIDRFYFERVLYVLNGDIRLLQEPIITGWRGDVFEQAKDFYFKEGKRCIIEECIDSNHVSFFMLYYLNIKNSTTLKLNNLPKNEHDIADIIADIQSYKRPEIIYPHI